MPKFSWNPFSKGGLPAQIFGASKDLLTGTPEKRENVSTLRPEQEPLLESAINAGLRPGAGGAFGEAADYYRGNLSNNPQDFNAFAAPALRQYNQEIIPGISEQFAGFGSGGLSSSEFRNAQTQGAVDLAERLGQLRASLRESSAQGLQNIGRTGLGNFSQNMVTQPGTEGLLAPLAGAAATAAFGPAAGQLGYQAGNWLKNSLGGNKVGMNSGPYQSSDIPASPQFNRSV